MNQTTSIAMAVLVSMAAGGGQAQTAEDATRVTVGLRGWYAQYPNWIVVKGTEACSLVGFPGCQAPDQSITVEPETRPLMLIPSLAVRKGRWLLSSSYGDMGTMTFTLLGQTGKLRRRELDLVGGYAVLPSASVTLGYKEVRLDVDGSPTRYKGVTLGASGSARLSDAVSLYGNVAFGIPGQFRAHLSEVDTDALGRRTFDLEYEVIEVGVAVALTALHEGPLPPVLTVGYRSQRMTVKNYHLGTGFGLSYPQTLGDSSYGFVLGLSKSF